ncbi:hypothetical protein B0H19DRAFT_1127820 [Mycena capillaripes]|nr:hypothetical protein B0H19DRAFT_1127820 [Mycena capillaripes]
MNCLEPPVEAMPAGKWYCPRCPNAAETERETSTSHSAATPTTREGEGRAVPHGSDEEEEGERTSQRPKASKKKTAKEEQASPGAVASTSQPAVQPRAETVASTSQIPTSTSAPIFKPEIKDEDDDLSIVESTMPLKYLTPLPEGRRKELEAFPEFVPDSAESEVFTRAFLSATLGGSHQPLIVKIGASQKPLAKDCGMNKFLCPNLNQNPWCPRSPGKHGYMFVGLGNENETFREPEQLNLFLSTPPQGSRNLEVTYLGVYEVSRASGLTVAEWETLSPAVQRNYTETTASRRSHSKTDKPKTVANIHAEYASGRLTVPCVRLVCVGFDEALSAGLLAANSRWNKRERDISDGDSPNKRRRTESTA